MQHTFYSYLQRFLEKNHYFYSIWTHSSCYFYVKVYCIYLLFYTSMYGSLLVQSPLAFCFPTGYSGEIQKIQIILSFSTVRVWL